MEQTEREKKAVLLKGNEAEDGDITLHSVCWVECESTEIEDEYEHEEVMRESEQTLIQEEMNSKEVQSIRYQQSVKISFIWTVYKINCGIYLVPNTKTSRS